MGHWYLSPNRRLTEEEQALVWQKPASHVESDAERRICDAVKRNWNRGEMKITNILLEGDAGSGKTQLAKALSADLVGYSNDADLALLKIRNYADFTGSASFEPVKLSSSSDLFYGDKVYTIGNPEDLGLILTELMVSSPAIKVSSDDSFSSIILDGTINHGNSGGALFDKYGNVVGVVYARIEGSNSDAYGIGCAIPLDTLKEFLDEARVKYTVATDQSTE